MPELDEKFMYRYFSRKTWQKETASDAHAYTGGKCSKTVKPYFKIKMSGRESTDGLL
jgi:hypothetical protein